MESGNAFCTLYSVGGLCAFPQRLKPFAFVTLYGRAEALPFRKLPASDDMGRTVALEEAYPSRKLGSVAGFFKKNFRVVGGGVSKTERSIIGQ